MCTEAIAERYRRFAQLEARGRSPLYVEVAARVATDDGALTFLAALPPAPDPDAFLLAVDGEPTAWTDGHGAWLSWLAPRA